MKKTLGNQPEVGENESSRSAADNSVPALTETPCNGGKMAPADSDSTGKSPAFQFYPKDFLHDSNVVLMNLAERGAYITLLCYCWSEGSIFSDPAKLAKFCGVSPSVMRRMWVAIAPCFRPAEEPGRLIHPRLEREREKQNDFKRRQSDNGKKGGRPPKPNESQNNPSLSSGLTQTEPKKSSSSLSAFASSSSDFSQRELTHRAGEFIEWYQDKHYELFGMGYIGNPQKDYTKAQELCQGLTDAELRDAALVWFGMHDDFATRGNRTIPKFASRVAECVQIARKVSA